jgi:hypothetical protein
MFDDDEDMVALGDVFEATDRREVDRLRNLVDALLRHTGGVPKECPHCGVIVRDATVVVGDKPGERRALRVVLEDCNFLRHTADRCTPAGRTSLAR